MYSKTPTGKAPKGSVRIISSHGRLQLKFRHEGKRHYVSVGLPDTPENRIAAEAKARQIKLDILSGHFDPTLARYKVQSALSTPASDVIPKLDELWEKFIEYKRPQCSPSTMRHQYRTFSNYLNDLPTYDLRKPSEIQKHILNNIPIDSAKRFILSGAENF